MGQKHAKFVMPALDTKTHLFIAPYILVMTEFSNDMSRCIAEWGQKAVACNGSVECLDSCAKDLRKCLDIAFPYSKNIEYESDKINYMLSTVFFLASRLSKSAIGLAKFDNSINNIQQIRKNSLGENEDKQPDHKLHSELEEIISEYF